jgi:hypothetical protein
VSKQTRLPVSINKQVFLAEREIAAWRKRRAERAQATLALEESRLGHLVVKENLLLLAERACTAGAHVTALKAGRGPSTQRTAAGFPRTRSGYRVLVRVNTEAGTVLTASGAPAGMTIEQLSKVLRQRFG